MKVYQSLEQIPSFNNAVVTIGTFDGVHEGHKKILTQLKTEASAINAETIVITFHPHPKKIVGDTTGVKLLTTLEEKIELLTAENIDHLVVVPFNEDFANLSAEDYIVQFLYKYFSPKILIIGYDHKFGKNRLGDYHLLEHYGHKLGFTVKEINEQILQEVAISSTRARKSLLQADLPAARALLGYDYFFEGTVIKGDQLGRTIGYPTANIQLNNEEKLVPGDGVYAVTVGILDARYKILDENTTIHKKPSTSSIQHPASSIQYPASSIQHPASSIQHPASSIQYPASSIQHPASSIQYPASNIKYQGMMYIGSRPVVNGKRRVIEVNIFNFNEDIYNQTVHVTVKQYIRGDMNFNGLEALKTQLALDKIASLETLNKNSLA